MNYPAVNRLFTAVCFTFPPILGSLVSVVWHGGAIWCLFEVVSGRRKLSPDGTMRLIALLFAIYVFWNIVSFAVNFTTFSDAERLIPLATFLLFPFSYSIWSISDKDEIARACVVGSVIACYGAFLISLFQFYVYGMRAEGGAGNALVFAQVSAVAASIALAAALQGSGRRQILCLGAFGTSAAAILLSGSRTDWVVIAADTVLVLFIYRREAKALLSLRIAALVLGLAVVTVALTAPFIWQRVDMLARDWGAISAQDDYSTSLGIRLALWQIGAELFVAHPFLGYGMHTTAGLIHENLVSHFGIGTTYSHFHNGFLTLLVQSGLIGMLSIAAIFVVAATAGIRTLRSHADRHRRLGAVILLVLVATYVISAGLNKLLGHDILDTMLVIFLIVGAYLAAGSSMPGRETANDPPHAIGTGI